jgi:hypothetical protein
MARFLGRARIWWPLNLSGIWMHVMKKEEMGLTQSLEKTRRKRDDDKQLRFTKGMMISDSRSGGPRCVPAWSLTGSHGQLVPKFFCLFHLPRQLVRIVCKIPL